LPPKNEPKEKAEVQGEEIDPEGEKVEGTFEGNVTERVANEPQSHPDPQAAQKEQEAGQEADKGDRSEVQKPGRPEEKTAEQAQKAGFEKTEKVREQQEGSGEPKFGEFDTSPTRQGNQYEASDRAKDNHLNLAIRQAQDAKRDYEEKKANAERMASDMDVQLGEDLSRPETDQEKEKAEQHTKETQEALKGTAHDQEGAEAS
jgi:hypothetical protein